VEADEYDKAFLSLQPTIAVVNTLEADHLECYGSMEALEDAFVEFANRAERVIVAPTTPAQIGRVSVSAPCGVWVTARRRTCAFARCGSSRVARAPRFRCRAVPRSSSSWSCRDCTTCATRGTIAVLQALGADVQAGARALSEFRGVGRRFERLVRRVRDGRGRLRASSDRSRSDAGAARQAFPGGV